MAESLVRAAMGQLNLSARGDPRVLKLARTMAGLARCENIGQHTWRRRRTRRGRPKMV